MASAPRFHRLAVSDVRRETPDAVSVAFHVPGDLASAYAFAPGQYLTLRATIDGEDLRRSYSICSGPDDGELRIAVKRVEGGPFSGWVNSDLKAGDQIDVLTPTGRFGIPNEPGPNEPGPNAPGPNEPGPNAPGPKTPGMARVLLGIAAGSGITPILSIARGVMVREPRSRFFLLYGNRSSADALFHEALAELKDRYLERLSIFYVLSREEQDVAILNGRLDRGKLSLLLRSLVPAAAIDHVLICGPEGMAEELGPVLEALGIPRERIHVERFVSALGGRPRAKPSPPLQAVAPGAPSQIATLIYDGKRRDVPVAEGEAILDAALRAGLDLPYACKGGMCATCRAKVIEGAAVMEVNYSLQAWEQEAGYVLTCQARPQTDRIIVDYDQV